MKEKEKIIEAKIEEEKCSCKNINKYNYIIIVSAFVVGAVIMFIFVNIFNFGTNNIIRKITTENVKTTTLEETSDLKSGINNVYDAVVYIEVTGERSSVASGSGFIYKSDDDYAYILTNYHVIDGGVKYVVTYSDKTEVEASLVGGDEYYDIAVLKVDVSTSPSVATLGDSDSIELGDSVFTVGSPLDKEYMGTITKGIISGVNRKVTVTLNSGNYLMEVIQTDASINSGNSGGPICNIRGEVIGITSSKLIGDGIEGMGFAIPINSVLDVLDGLESGTTVERPYLGVQLVDLSNTFALQYYYRVKISSDISFGAVISYVEDGKAASKSGLQVGDVIIEIDSEKVDDVSHFKYLLYKHNVGDTINVKYYRDNSILETNIELTDSIKSE